MRQRADQGGELAQISAGLAQEHVGRLHVHGVHRGQIHAELLEEVLARFFVAALVRPEFGRRRFLRLVRQSVHLLAQLDLALGDEPAERLQMGKPASVSQYVRRFRLAGRANERDFKRALSKVTP